MTISSVDASEWLSDAPARTRTTDLRRGVPLRRRADQTAIARSGLRLSGRCDVGSVASSELLELIRSSEQSRYGRRFRDLTRFERSASRSRFATVTRRLCRGLQQRKLAQRSIDA